MQAPASALLASNRRIWLFLLSALVAIVVGFFALSDRMAMLFVANGSFWMVLVTFGIFLHALWRTYRADLPSLHWRKLDWATVAVVTLGGIVLLVHETFGFKILMDEIMLLGTSMNMHFNKTALMPIRGNDIQGSFVILDGLLDKRPFFFPFLVSLLHDLTGYRPANAFILNGMLTFVFLGLVNALGRMLAGRLAGWLGVALFAGLPLLAHNATGAGFELLNLVMILGTLLLGARYIERADEASCTAFVFSGMLLAQVRYESVLYLLPVAAIVLWVWRREGRMLLPAALLFAPLLLVHYPLQNRVFSVRAAVWELASKPGYTKPFSAEYISENFFHALKFFFGKPSDQPNSLVFSVLGALAVPFFCLLVLKQLKILKTLRPTNVAVTFFAFGFAAQFLLMMCYFWGRFDEPVIRRLSLPTHLGLLIAVLAVLPQFAWETITRALLSVAALAVLAMGVPSMAAHAYSQEYLPGKETAWRRQFMADQPRRDYLVIDNDAMLWIMHEISATTIQQAINRRDAMIYLMRNRTFSNVYVFQRYNIDATTGAMTLREGDDLGPGFVLETVREERLQTLTLSRLSRLKEIREGEVSLTPPRVDATDVKLDRADIEKARRAYLENYLKQLP